MDQRTGDRRADRLTGPVETHRDGERPAVPRGIGAALPHREHADVEGTVRQPRDQQGQGHQPHSAREGEKRDGESEHDVRNDHDPALPSLAAETAGNQRGGNRGEAEDGPQSAHQRGIAVQPLEHHDRQRNEENAKAEIQDRRGKGDPTERGVVDEHIGETGPRLREDGARRTGDDRLGQEHDQHGRQQKNGRGDGERKPGARQGGQRPGQGRTGAHRQRVGDAVKRVDTIPELPGNDQGQQGARPTVAERVSQ